MQSLWNDAEADRFQGDLALRVYSSRLLGREPSLVLHGGGNTSVKVVERNRFGDDEDILYVKGSGWDLETIEVGGFSPCRREHLLRLAGLERLCDVAMARELRTSLIDPGAAAPSVEAILHALLPARYVDHTHADAFITVCNTPDGRENLRRIYGERVLVVPYVMPGFLLARACAEILPRLLGDATIGVALMHHGLISFGDSARQSYERMIELVTLAERFAQERRAWDLPSLPPAPPCDPAPLELAALRADLSKAAGAPMILACCPDERARAFARRNDCGAISGRGPATPDHVIRTKRLPLIGRDVQAYAAAYAAVFAELSPTVEGPLAMLDPAPRVILDRDWGLLTAGRSVKDAAICADIYRHTIKIILRAEALGGWRALPAADLFAMEYWDLEQAKLRKAGKPAPFAGEVALVTGAASGIGKACVESLLARGAAVAALDLNPAITTLFGRTEVLGLVCDLTDEAALTQALRAAVRAFGGVDMAILNAGIFPPSRAIAATALEDWRRVFRINVDANLVLLRELHPLLKLAPRGGRVAIIGSKNVPAPGPGASAYSASKAAVNQLARVAALEWGCDGIRINTLHPNAVFDTGIWTPEVLAKRAANYKMSVDEYRRNNVLRTEVASRDVAELAAELCGALFAKTTGAQIPVDGGNERVI